MERGRVDWQRRHGGVALTDRPYIISPPAPITMAMLVSRNRRCANSTLLREGGHTEDNLDAAANDILPNYLRKATSVAAFQDCFLLTAGCISSPYCPLSRHTCPTPGSIIQEGFARSIFEV